MLIQKKTFLSAFTLLFLRSMSNDLRDFVLPKKSRAIDKKSYAEFLYGSIMFMSEQLWNMAKFISVNYTIKNLISVSQQLSD